MLLDLFRGELVVLMPLLPLPWMCVSFFLFFTCTFFSVHSSYFVFSYIEQSHRVHIYIETWNEAIFSHTLCAACIESVCAHESYVSGVYVLLAVQIAIDYHYYYNFAGECFEPSMIEFCVWLCGSLCQQSALFFSLFTLLSFYY